MSAYPDVKLFIDGQWIDGGGPGEQVFNPADLDRALAAAEKGFQQWRKVSPSIAPR
jgi:succinate-semialdehyde dehydrogenase/glutarate-semialdehyde dehydrogenase